MSKYNTAPTKTNLIRIKNELKFAKLGYELLDQKRNILIIELLAIVDKAVEFQGKVEDLLGKAFHQLDNAVLRMGKLNVLYLTNTINIKSNITLTHRKVMGVTLPVINTEFEDNSPYYSPSNTSFWIDSSMKYFKISLIRLANEVKKTIRKVNALEKIAIPDFLEQVNYIQGRLEENEREMFVLMKQVKRKLDKKRKKAKKENNK